MHGCFNFQLQRSMLVPYVTVCSSAAARSSCLFTDIADTKNQKQISRTRKEHHDGGIENSLTKSHAHLRDGVCETKIASSLSSLEIITVLRWMRLRNLRLKVVSAARTTLLTWAAWKRAFHWFGTCWVRSRSLRISVVTVWVALDIPFQKAHCRDRGRICNRGTASETFAASPTKSPVNFANSSLTTSPRAHSVKAWVSSPRMHAQKLSNRPTDRQTDKQTNKQTNNQTDQQRDGANDGKRIDKLTDGRHRTLTNGLMIIIQYSWITLDYCTPFCNTNKALGVGRPSTADFVDKACPVWVFIV